VTTIDTPCDCPPDALRLPVSADKYIDREHLPQRLIDTIAAFLERAQAPWDVLILAEYDTLFIKRIEVEKMEHGMAAHLAGFKPWGSKADKFYHNPLCFLREPAQKFVAKGRELLHLCTLGSPESSPDVFYGLVCQEAKLPVQTNLWLEYSRNSLDVEGHLEEARLAYRNGFSIIHGIKRKEELDYIIG
jgi:hypothetical protein